MPTTGAGGRSVLAALALLHVVVAATAGEIAGLPGNLPPTVDQPFEINFSNDFLGRGGSVDDFRTQQLIVGGPLSRLWTLTLDHSTLTRTDPTSPGRIDQLSATLGYRLLDAITGSAHTRITAGAGLRSTGDLGGEKMQNGFHRLIDSAVEVLPYQPGSGTDATAWIDMHHYRCLRDSIAGNPAWSAGYWVRASSMLTTAGEWDNAIGVYGVASRDNFDGWLGLRSDWRSGYEDEVLRQTADAESDTAVVIGLRWGPVVLETVQQFKERGSYGQLRVISLPHAAGRQSSRQRQLALSTGFQVPDVLYRLDARYAIGTFGATGAGWKPSVIIRTAFGEPQYESNPSLYIHTAQLTGGLEWERFLNPGSMKTSAYVSIAAGMRREELVGEGDRLGQSSAAVSRGAIELGVGTRIQAATMGDRWRYRLELGITALFPLNDARLDIGEESITVQQPTVGAFLGMSFDRDR